MPASGGPALVVTHLRWAPPRATPSLAPATRMAPVMRAYGLLTLLRIQATNGEDDCRRLQRSPCVDVVEAARFRRLPRSCARQAGRAPRGAWYGHWCRGDGGLR